jgi:glycosyltransferase involved in cell wall biosynthesis
MRLSVVVPALNEERNVARAVASARVGAGADGCEVVVVDGGSDDATVSAAHRAGADLVLVSPERGRAAQLARGVERASGDVIVFLHADSTLPDAYAERMHDAMRPEHTWGAFGFRLGSSSDDDEASAASPSTISLGHRTEEPMARRFLEWCVDKRTRWLGSPYGDQGLWVRRDALASVGGVPQQCFMEDYELVRRLRRAHGMPCVVDAAVTTSSRRWDAMGVARVTALNRLVVFGYAMGVPPERLARLYTAGRNMGGGIHVTGKDGTKVEATRVETR